MLRRKLYRWAHRGVAATRGSGVLLLAHLFLRVLHRLVRYRGILEIRDRHGVLFLPGDDQIITTEILFGRGHEEALGRVLTAIVSPGDTVLEIGANVGIHTRHLARLAGSSGRVHAVEPDPENLRLLRACLEANGLEGVHIHEMALSDRVGTATLHRDRWNRGGHTLQRENVSTIYDDAVTVRTVTLDALAEAEGLRPDLLKMDAQGWEGHVLDGGSRLLEESGPALLFEFWPEGLRRAGTDPAGLLERLFQLGYAVEQVVESDSSVDGPMPTSIPEWVERARSAGHLNLLLRIA